MDVLLTVLGLFGLVPIVCMTVLYGVVPIVMVGLQVVGLLAAGDRPGFARAEVDAEAPAADIDARAA